MKDQKDDFRPFEVQIKNCFVNFKLFQLKNISSLSIALKKSVQVKKKSFQKRRFVKFLFSFYILSILMVFVCTFLMQKQTHLKAQMKHFLKNGNQISCSFTLVFFVWIFLILLKLRKAHSRRTCFSGIFFTFWKALFKGTGCFKL